MIKLSSINNRQFLIQIITNITTINKITPQITIINIIIIYNYNITQIDNQDNITNKTNNNKNKQPYLQNCNNQSNTNKYYNNQLIQQQNQCLYNNHLLYITTIKLNLIKYRITCNQINQQFNQKVIIMKINKNQIKSIKSHIKKILKGKKLKTIKNLTQFHTGHPIMVSKNKINHKRNLLPKPNKPSQKIGFQLNQNKNKIKIKDHPIKSKTPPLNLLSNFSQHPKRSIIHKIALLSGFNLSFVPTTKITITKNWKHPFDVLVMSKFCRTFKLLYAICKGLPTVSLNWILESQHRRGVVPFQKYYLPGPPTHKNLITQSTILVREGHKILKNIKFYLIQTSQSYHIPLQQIQYNYVEVPHENNYQKPNNNYQIQQQQQNCNIQIKILKFLKIYKVYQKYTHLNDYGQLSSSIYTMESQSNFYQLIIIIIIFLLLFLCVLLLCQSFINTNIKELSFIFYQ